MNKIKLLVLSLVLTGMSQVTTSAQSFQLGQKDLSFGVGFGSPWITTGYNSTIPPISVAFDYGLRDDIGPGVISLGGYFGISGYRYKYPGVNYGWSYTTAIFMIRAAYHYEFADKLDTYAGFGLGIRTLSHKEYGTFPDGLVIRANSGVMAAGSIHIGAKYYFTDKIAGFAELGYGIAYMTLGVSLKL